jgi:polysaccharide biosynthesis/export protein
MFRAEQTVMAGRVMFTSRSLMLATCVVIWCLRCWGQSADEHDKFRAGAASSAGLATERKDTQPSMLARAARDETFVIGAEDVLEVNVWKEADISRTVTVRSDGKISLPLVGELQASAKTPKQLEDEISSKLSDFISEPSVTVMVQETRSHRFNILGRVEHPGSYPVAESARILDAIAIAGGFRDFAKQKSIYVLRNRPDGSQARLRFNYKEVIKGQHLEQNIKLEPHDTVVVP